MLATNLPLITVHQIDQSFFMGPQDQKWTIIDVNEEKKQVLCNLAGTRDSVWLPDHLVYDLIESHNDIIDRLNAFGGC